MRDLLRANVDNLAAFWSACGVEERGALRRSTRWPGRAWFDFGYRPNAEDVAKLLRDAREATVPQWPGDDPSVAAELDRAGFVEVLVQQAMVLAFEGVEPTPSSALVMRDVDGVASTTQWARVASEAFGYTIDLPSIEALLGRDEFDVWLAFDGEDAVGSGLLAQTGEVAGMHMVGVPPAHRRKGYARQIMFGLLERARERGCAFATLQASAAGEPLYRQLGFEGQGEIRSCRRVG